MTPPTALAAPLVPALAGRPPADRPTEAPEAPEAPATDPAPREIPRW